MAPPEKPWYLPMLCRFIDRDIPALVGIPPAALARDVITLEHRVTGEGEAFLTKTLPSFGKAFDFALQERAPLTVSGFRKRKPRSALPAFLQALLERVFDEAGYVLENPCTKSIRAIRQVTLWCKKVEKGFTDEALQIAVSKFKTVDSALPDLSNSTNPGLLGRARFIVEWIFRNGPRIHDLFPKHGPGAVAWGEGVADKYRLRDSYRSLERVFRPIPWMRSLRDASEHPECITGRPAYHCGFSRLAFVEKDSSGPRLIGLEPAEYMWCQQALKAWLYHYIERVCPLTMGRVNFTDQSINQRFTNDWQTWDTLDMSSASDRNSYQLVKYLFERTGVWRFLEASRTPGVVLPGGEVFFYKKFAPMGSAVCFPVEAIVFFALTVASLAKAGMPLILALKRVYVYGDDLIVPHGFFDTLDEDFRSVGLEFSTPKCCISGKFRESCGRDAYDGEEVTPLRLRRPWTVDNDLGLISLIKHHNLLMLRGFRSAAVALRCGMQSRFPLLGKWSLPYTDDPELPILAWFDPERKSTVKSFVKNSIPYVQGYHLSPLKRQMGQAEEQYFLRVSLSTGGPVGVLHRNRGLRMLPLRYDGKVQYKRLPYTRNAAGPPDWVKTLFG